MTGPGDRIPAIMERVNLVELVTEFAGPSLSNSGGTATFRCPSDGHSDTHPSFTVKGDRWRCWSQCGQNGRAIDFMQFIGACGNVAEAIELLSARVGLPRTWRDPAGRSGRARLAPEVAREVLVEYLIRRSWSPDLAGELGLTVVRDRQGVLRVRHPFRLDGKTVGWQARAVDDSSEPRWRSSTGPIRCPYEADRLDLADERRIVLVAEGVSDVVSILTAVPDLPIVGIPGVSGFKREWAAAFGDVHVLIVGDNDEAGSRFRANVASAVGAHTHSVSQVPVPAHFNDVSDWLLGVGDADTFGSELLEACGVDMGGQRDS